MKVVFEGREIIFSSIRNSLLDKLYLNYLKLKELSLIIFVKTYQILIIKSLTVVH